MANADGMKMYSERYVKDIADAIREKNKQTRTYNIEQMSGAIRELGQGLIDTEITIQTAEYTTVT